MKAAILNKYDKNGTDLEIKDIDMPKMGNDDVLVKIVYAGVNPLDNMIIREEVKLITPYKLPLVMGNEFSGVVEEVGSNVSGFKKGDRVYARMPLDKIGAFAEYVSINKDALAHIPNYLDFDKAACVPLTALTAIQAFELMNIKSGESIFISGGTGSLGAMAIPIAKSFGLKVMTSGSARNEERVTALGVDEFFDYRTQDYSEILSDVDYVLDTLGEKELEKEFKILKHGGSLVSLKGLPNKEFAERMGFSFVKKTLFGFAGKKFDKLANKKNQKYYFIFVESNGSQLEKVSEIFEQNKIEVSVDEIYDLSDVNNALKKVDKGGSKGKTLIKI
ncbi:MAG: NADP-dependent oxidoreductase [Methanobrevibacter sp.]|uniref:NADP-dependent oxidoreductase n=1 Tax=Methanobrevibacter sp. TaxID=66852 RepID=UPI001B2D6083|nr:NADP-dependent oxidoreductase [Methanobrevibacter sp.]MBO5152612.1 NADP-dependent oxidoreductase [Methanobrevibacter sp.]MBO6111129.1 NADP-dependent oxidoreductase [Methanobrevibacter sp.]